MMTFFTKIKKEPTDFSKFIRTASSGEKKRVFKRVLKRASQDQWELVERASTIAR